MNKIVKTIFYIISIIIAIVESYFIVAKEIFGTQFWKYILLGMAVFFVYQIILQIASIFIYNKENDWRDKPMDLYDINLLVTRMFFISSIFMGFIVGQRSILNLLIGALASWLFAQGIPRYLISRFYSVTGGGYSPTETKEESKFDIKFGKSYIKNESGHITGTADSISVDTKYGEFESTTIKNNSGKTTGKIDTYKF